MNDSYLICVYIVGDFQILIEGIIRPISKNNIDYEIDWQ